MHPHYFEVTIHPSHFYDTFSDFLLTETGEAIEEREGVIVVRTERDPSSLIGKVESFSETLSTRTGKQVNVQIQSKQKENRDWLQCYQNSVQPILIGDIYIHPSWHKPLKNSYNIVVDPALAFGSGHHESTSMCINLLRHYVQQGKTVLDVGCGSGILALVASKLGGEVDLCDTDESAILESRKNFDRNNLSFRRAWIGSSCNTNQKYDIVSANIVADVLETIASDLMACLHETSVLIMSGILEHKKHTILRKFRQLKLSHELTQNEWVSLVMRVC
jgi:ribosomal protein L11 methyltransferase